MPLYEYRCRTCATRFEARRAMTDADAPVACPDGHDDAVRLLSVFASTGRAGASPTPSPAMSGAPRGGGCGGACACAH